MEGNERVGDRSGLRPTGGDRHEERLHRNPWARSGVRTWPYRINTPATSTIRTNEHKGAAPSCRQEAKCFQSGLHLSAGIEVLTLESVPSLVTSWQITL